MLVHRSHISSPGKTPQRSTTERLARINDRHWLEILAGGGYGRGQGRPLVETIGARIAESWDAARDRRYDEEGS